MYCPRQVSRRTNWLRSFPLLNGRVASVRSGAADGIVNVTLEPQIAIVGIGGVDVVPGIGFDGPALDVVVMGIAVADTVIAPLLDMADRDVLFAAYAVSFFREISRAFGGLALVFIPVMFRGVL